MQPDPRSPSAAPATVLWTIYALRKHTTDRWVQWESYLSKEDGLKALSVERAAYPHYEIELRKRTITEERVDA